jgi:hypothetical protein
MLAEILDPAGAPAVLRSGAAARLGWVYSQQEAAAGQFGLDTLSASLVTAYFATGVT